MLIDTKQSPNAKLVGLSYDDVCWTGGLYQERINTCAKEMVPHLQKMFESKEVSHVLENFKIAAGEATGDFKGTVFGDGDFYKWMEAAIYTAVIDKNQVLLQQLEEYIELIRKAQQPDGYISTKQIIGEKSRKTQRMGDINDFEVYNFGHLFTSACLYFRLTGKDNFLQIAEKAAGYLYQLYEEADKKQEVQTAVCPSHYMGLAELYRTTGNKKYLTLLKKSIFLRDSVQNGMDDNQDRRPLKEHNKIIGHAVRANYLYAGVTDLCLEEDQPELVEVLHKVWNNLIHTKMYITGGCGALYNGASPYGNFFSHQLVHQAYGYEYQLPNITAYNETCASVGGVYWAYRMFCLEKRAEYVDILERMLLNVNLAAVSMDGKKYFYENMLRRTKSLPYELVWGVERAEYILSYCCPPNLARLMAQISEYAYALDEQGIYTVLYGSNKANVTFMNGSGCTIEQITEYPYDGKIRFLFENVSKDCSFNLNLRIPGWVRKGKVNIINKYNQTSCFVQNIDKSSGSSYLTLNIEKPLEIEVLLDLSMEPRLTTAHPYVEENINQVAVEKGPLVYCMEGMDALADSLDDILIPSDIEFCLEDYVIEGRRIQALKGTFIKQEKESKSDQKGNKYSTLYENYEACKYQKIDGRMIPYFAWDNRGKDEMRIWLPLLINGW